MNSSFAEAKERAGDRLVCKLGCTQCCHGAFVVSPLDALRLRAGMEKLRETDPELAAEVTHRADMWVVEHGPEFPGDVETGVLGNSKEERESFEGFANAAACPALDSAALLYRRQRGRDRGLRDAGRVRSGSGTPRRDSLQGRDRGGLCAARRRLRQRNLDYSGWGRQRRMRGTGSAVFPT
ncbi:MAG: hypothetical protein ABR991_10350 [Terracidiphilus sp.]